MINKDNVRSLSQDELRICQTEYIRRWRYTHKDRVNATNRDYRKNKKQFKKIVKPLDLQDLKPEPVKDLNIFSS